MVFSFPRDDGVWYRSKAGANADFHRGAWRAQLARPWMHSTLRQRAQWRLLLACPDRRDEVYAVPLYPSKCSISWTTSSMRLARPQNGITIIATRR